VLKDFLFEQFVAVAVAFVLGGVGWASAAQSEALLLPGSGRFVFSFVSAGERREIPVWYHRPQQASTEAKIVFVLHGDGRDAQTHRKDWIPAAEQNRFMLLVPEFSQAEFPGTASYNLGNLSDRRGARYPEAQWSYTAIEDIFDAVRKHNALSAATYDLYGHSAGAQFVHRMVMLKPDSRFRIAVAANAGWYMTTDYSVTYPYGLAGANVGRKQLAQAFTRKLVVLVGDADIDPNHRALSRTPAAMLQGQHRFERGQNFYARAKRTAAELNVPLAWTLKIAPGVAHSNALMVPFAVLELERKD
jgi:poly(3-hydroxybutyrate) depolymerase